MMRQKAIFILTALLVFGFVLHGDSWFNDYQNGLKQLKKERWKKAADYFQKAIDQKPMPSLRAKTIGLRFIEYLPYFHLGSARYHLKVYPAALEAFKKSLESGIIQKKGALYSTLLDLQQQCQARIRADHLNKEPAVESKPKPTETTDSPPAVDPVAQQLEKGDNFRKSGLLGQAKTAYQSALKTAIHLKREPQVLVLLEKRIQALDHELQIRKLKKKADMLFANQSYKELKLTLSRILVIDPENAYAHQFLKQTDQYLAEQRKANHQEIAQKKRLKTADADKTEELSILKQEALSAYRNGDIDRAQLLFETIQKREPDNAETLHWFEKIRFRKAARSLNQAIRLYISGNLGQSIVRLKQMLPGLSEDRQLTGLLVRAYQFIALIQLEHHFLGSDQTIPYKEDAKKYIEKIYQLDPDFKIEKNLFSPKIVRFFKQQTGSPGK